MLAGKCCTTGLTAALGDLLMTLAWIRVHAPVTVLAQGHEHLLQEDSLKNLAPGGRAVLRPAATAPCSSSPATPDAGTHCAEASRLFLHPMVTSVSSTQLPPPHLNKLLFRRRLQSLPQGLCRAEDAQLRGTEGLAGAGSAPWQSLARGWAE